MDRLKWELEKHSGFDKVHASFTRAAMLLFASSGPRASLETAIEERGSAEQLRVRRAHVRAHRALGHEKQPRSNRSGPSSTATRTA